MGHTFLCLLGFFSLNILFYRGHSQDLVLTIEPNLSTFFTWESVTLICDMRDGENTDWVYTILKDGQEIVRFIRSYTLQHLARNDNGVYQCFGRLRSSLYRSEYVYIQSNKVSLSVSDANVILARPASVLYEGESVTLRCRHRTQRTNKNASFYKNGWLIETDTSHQSQHTAEITFQPESEGSSYMCRFDEDEESEPTELRLELHRPKAKLRKDRIYVPVGGNVTLTCSVDSPSPGWTHFWYRGKKSSEPLAARDAIFISNAKISVPQGGVYWCRGGRGEPVYYTEYSDSVVTHRTVVTLQPSWPEIYTGEAVTLTCEIENGGDIEWEYEWALPVNVHTTHTTKQYKTAYAQLSHNGNYRCLGRMKDGKSGTEWSDPFILTISDKTPDLFLTVSPLWLSSGDPVTLRCHIKHPSAGWRFYWYQVVSSLSTNPKYELLPGSSEGTAQDSYIVHRQMHTARYVCRGGRGDPVQYTYYSAPKFVWSGDLHSAASLTVSPDRGQHLYKESVSLSCEGNSTMWRVSRLSKIGYLTSCSSWGKMIGSTCHIHQAQSIDGVYWCESETGQFSNAVNITGQNKDIILTSPIHPVAEGDSVTLGCKLSTENVASDVNFYKNGKLIQNDTRREQIIPAVSKSDEGFYKCEGRRMSRQGGQSWTSAESWMSVKTVSRPQSPLVPVVLIVGLVCGGLLIILMLLLLAVVCYTKSKDSRVVRSQSTNQGSATDHMTNQDETQQYFSLPQVGDDCLYESIKGPEDAENDESSDVTYSLIELKNFANKGKHNEPEESAVYSNTGSTAGKSSPAEANETVYSEVRIRTSS